MLPVPKRSRARLWLAWAARSPVALALGLGLAAALLYLSRRSISLDDFDSVSFALALRDFNLFVQQPQPPGFPVYIALGRALFWLHADPRWALVTLSALGGGVAVAATFGIGYLLSGGRRAAGLCAALLLGLIPIFWLSSEKALSDVPALAALLVAILLLLVARQRAAALWPALAGLASGLSLGFRPQNVLALLPFALALALALARCRRWRGLAALAASGLAGVALWLVPVVEISLGPSLYLQLLRIQGRHVWQTDSLFAAGPLSLGRLHARLSGVLALLVQQSSGLTLPARFAGPLQLALALALLGGLGLLLYAERRRPLVWLTAAWLALGLAQYALLESLDSPRLMLLFVPALVLLVSLALARLPGRALGPLLVALSLLLLVAGWGPASILATQQTPPMQAAGYLRAHYSPSDTLLLAAGSFRHLHYALPNYSIYYGYYLDRDKLAADLDGGRFRQVVVVDPESFTSVDDLLGVGGRYLPTGDRVFARDPRAHSQHSRVDVVILTRADLVRPESSSLSPAQPR
ncbi:MAG TPA: glycosyltransferase family 39 protein [Thermomicrobiaceae bacterium]|nr:glycosyltransferase family 39 protein [Thermomicrobiaceae bacterium]